MTEIHEKSIDEEWNYLSPIIDYIEQKNNGNDDNDSLFPYLYLNKICIHQPSLSYIFVECLILIINNFLIELDGSDPYIIPISDINQAYLNSILVSVL